MSQNRVCKRHRIWLLSYLTTTNQLWTLYKLEWNKRMLMKEKGNYFENIKHFSFAYVFVWVRKLDSDSLTETKNWSGRNKVIETSGRLHPLWPQNKRLRTPWTTDWMNTRQYRWIQSELVFALAKNATKTESLWNLFTTDHMEEEHLEDRRNVGENSCNSGDGTDQRVQSLMFMLVMMMMMMM
jgi:hypothetical protein